MTSPGWSDPVVDRAAALGVEVVYEDVDQVRHEADLEVLGRVVDVLEDDAARSRRTAVPPVHLSGHGPVRLVAPIADARLDVAGRTERVDPRPDGDGTVVVELPAELPVGCHELVVDTGSATESCLVVVAPPAMPGLPGDRRRSSLFVPAYALWERDAPLPSFDHLRTVGASLREHGIDLLATLPIYATFLDEPYDPSPYSPISRLHWNEVYLDDGPLPSSPVPAMGEMVDWRTLAERRRHQLVEAARAIDDGTQSRLEQFLTTAPDVADYARFRAAREAAGDPVVERSHQLAQLWCDEQLAAVRRAAGVSLSLDLPVGSHPAGYEVWAHPELFAPATAVGAPPDTFFRSGQNWGFPPQLPGAMRDTGYALWRRMIERAARHCDLLRIDHVMAVHRLWWVPDGESAARGVYVRYRRDELLAVIAATAAAAGVGIVGENLGTVPPEVADALDEWQVLGMYEEQFMMEGPSLAEIPERSVAGVRTHDMAAFAAFAAETDLTAYEASLARAGVPRRDDGELYDSVLARLAASDARVVVADLDDLLDESRPHNLPGRVVPGIWQRRLPRPTSDILSEPAVTRRLDILGRKT